MTAIQIISITSLPALGTALEDGIFAGITTTKSGVHRAVILLPEQAKDVTWKDALGWAEKQGGELPSRPVAAMLFANVKASLPSDDWHWTSDQYDASYAWVCNFGHGYQTITLKSYEGSAVAVRLISLIA